MSNQTTLRSYGPPASSWSNRILLLATAGILFLTMYPFRFSFHVLPHGASPFLLGNSGKGGGFADAFLNVLLFVPFGFGLAEKLRERKISRGLVLVAALACGAVFSYTIEFLQLYIPERDSGWEDVFTNGSGSLVGAIFYLGVGAFIVRTLAAAEQRFRALLTARRIVVLLLVYLCICFVLGAFLQMQSRLSNWNSDAILIVGNDASGRNPWHGQIQSVQIWNSVLPDRATAPGVPDLPIINYDFASLTGSTLQLRTAPQLFWIPATPEKLEGPGLDLDGKSWLSTKTYAGDLAESLNRTSRFTIRLVCTPLDFADAWGRILYITDSNGVPDVMIRQENTSLGIGFRTPLSSRHAQLIWSVPGVFNDRRQREIVYRYDGSDLSLTVDGQKPRVPLRFGPGAALARVIRRVKPSELEGYNIIFYAMVFFTSGALLGFSAFFRRIQCSVPALLSALLALCLATLILEFILVRVSGRIFSPGNIALSVALGIAGYLWSTADNDTRGGSLDRIG